MNTLDIIILIFLACVIVYAITFNVNHTLNSKLSNIAVNIPPITIPPAQITVKVQKANGLNDSYEVFVEREKNELNGQVVALSPIEGFSEIVVNNQNTQQNLKQSAQLTELSQPLIQNNNNIQKLEHSPIENQNIYNKSLMTNNINAYGQMFMNSRGINDFTYPMCSDCCDNILSDDRSEDCVVKDYRKYQQYVKTYLEDPVIRGSNVNDYDNLSNISDIGQIDLKNAEPFPRPEGYIFHTSPAYNR